MRYHILALLFLLSTCFAASAQFQRGDLFLSGSLEFSTDKETSELTQVSLVELSVLPRLGYFATDNLALGLGLSYNYQREQFESKETIFAGKDVEKLQLFGPELSLRRYWPLRPNFGLWLDFAGSASFGRITFEEESPFDSSESRQAIFLLGAAIRPGAYLFVSRRLALEASLGGLSYTHFRLKDADDGSDTVSKSNAYSFLLDGNNLGLRLGLSWFLNRGGE